MMSYFDQQVSKVAMLKPAENPGACLTCLHLIGAGAELWRAAETLCPNAVIKGRCFRSTISISKHRQDAQCS